jgi:SAM-dependent methyltransferase
MGESKPEFDQFSGAYGELLEDPLRQRFNGGAGAAFHVRKRDLIRDFFKRQRVATRKLRWLDVGCGKGELLTLLRDDFGEVCGCDPSAGMLEGAKGIQTYVQPDPPMLPFDDGRFDFVTAVCVYHHVAGNLRPTLTAEVRRVLRPGGWFAIIEHNPYNPLTRLIVSRTPVDADAVLLRPSETRRLLGGGFRIEALRYFLYFPEGLYRSFSGLERVLRGIPLGGQYAVFARAQ